MRRWLDQLAARLGYSRPSEPARPDLYPESPPQARALYPAADQTMGGSGVQVGRDQTVHGDLIIGGGKTEVNTGGGTYVNGNVDTRGGDFIGRDRSL